ncbi:hypothetical protein KQH82_00170 [bacterium]|nr:hypothetical protein [bacterium]
MKVFAVRLVLVAACVLAGSHDARATIHNVSVDNNFFSPASVTVSYGDTVRWTLINGVHTSTSDIASRRFWDSGTLNAPGHTYDVVFTPMDGPGPFPYHCIFHAGMVGTVLIDHSSGPEPNAEIPTAAGPFVDATNPAIAIHERVPGELYAVFTEFLVAGAAGPSQVGWGWSSSGGLTGTWSTALKAPDFAFNEEWNAWLSATNPAFGGFVMVSSQRDSGPFGPGNCAIVANISTGGGAPFGNPTPLSTNNPGLTWLDYPVVEVDDNPASPAFGDALFAWVEYTDATGGDADGNGNPFDDLGDVYTINSASTAIGSGTAPPYPGTTVPFSHVIALPVYAGSMVSHRPAIDIAGPNNPLLPPGGAYVAWLDVLGGAILVDASPTPGAGGPWGALTAGAGPLAVLGYIPVPPTIAPGITGTNTVTIACDNAPNSPCPGAVYLAWTDMINGDIDIMFASSFDGGRTWSLPVRVNQDPIGNGLDQWAPHMRVDEYSSEIIVAYYDRRNNPGNTDIEVWASHSNDCGLTWTDCLLSDQGPTPSISNTPFPTAVHVGDYVSVDQTAAQGPAYVWNDARQNADQTVYMGSHTNCCKGLAGNVNGVGGIDLSDLIYLVNYLFGGGPPPPCPSSANINGTGGVDLSDLIYLVNYLFSGGPAPARCDPRC